MIIRGDSGFATPAFYEACDERDFYFVVRLKANPRLGHLAEAEVDDEPLDFNETKVVYRTLAYQPATWAQAYRVIVRSIHKAGEVVAWTHTFLVTNMVKSDPAVLFKAYQGRGTVENNIKELKTGFGVDKTDSFSFIRNSARALISGAAYNLIQLFKQLLIPEDRGITMDSLRFSLFHIAGKVTCHAHQIVIRLASNHVIATGFGICLRRFKNCGYSQKQLNNYQPSGKSCLVYLAWFKVVQVPLLGRIPKLNLIFSRNCWVNDNL